MAELTDLTIAGARDGLKARKFSAREIARAHLDAMERARDLNAFITETPDVALKMADAAGVPYDALTQGAGGLNALGAVTLAKCHRDVSGRPPALAHEGERTDHRAHLAVQERARRGEHLDVVRAPLHVKLVKRLDR